jgi:hypothetical protein
MQLSPHFSLDELTLSATAVRAGVSNRPPPLVITALTDTAARMETVRTLLGGRTIAVSSGYRGPALNRLVGGAKGSAHLTGRAVDFNCRGFGSPLEVCRALSRARAEGRLAYDQLIHEYGRWIHISFDPRMRGEDLSLGAGIKRAGHYPV